MSNLFRSTDAALSHLLDAISILGLVEESLNNIDGDEVPFSACEMEATMRTVKNMAMNVHYYLEEQNKEERA